MRTTLFLVAMFGLSACAAQPQQKSLTLAEARERYAHLYASMETAYNDPAFGWFDKRPLPKR